MKTSITLLVFTLIFAFAIQKSFCQELTREHQDSLKSIVDFYFEQSIKIYQKDSEPEDIDELFNQFTDDFVYVHPKYGGEYSRQDLYEGYHYNQENGGYNGSVSGYKINNTIIGLNGVAVERVFIKKEEDGSTYEVDHGMTLFEFKDGKIQRIKEYW